MNIRNRPSNCSLTRFVERFSNREFSGTELSDTRRQAERDAAGKIKVVDREGFGRHVLAKLTAPDCNRGDPVPREPVGV